MNQIIQLATSRSLQLSVFIVIFILEILAISLAVDARSLQHDNCSQALCWLAYSGDIIKILILWVTIACILINRRLINYVSEVLSQPTQLGKTWMGLQLAAFACFFVLSQKVFQTNTAEPATIWSHLWILTGILCAIFFILAIASPAFWMRLLKDEKGALSVSALLAVLTFMLSKFTEDLWHPLSDATFFVAASFLELSGLEVIKVPELRHLGIEDFIVNIAPSCSGYEGIGLITAFCSAYLYIFRAEFVFPRALLLFPIGIVCIWLFNALRIAILIYLGHAWSPGVAIGGFHSQAGWISFIACALGVIWLAHSSNFYTKVVQSSTFKESQEIEIDSSLSLIPILVLLGSNLIIGAISTDFDFLYPVKAILIALSIAYVWKKLSLKPFMQYAEPFFAACLVSIFWYYLIPIDSEYNQSFQSSLDSMSETTMILWMIARLIGAILLIPIAEELGFRGYLLCKLDRKAINLDSPLRPSILAIATSSIVFGVLHNAWLAGTLAGVVFAILRIRGGHVGSAILGHMITNAILFYIAWSSGYWHLL